MPDISTIHNHNREAEPVYYLPLHVCCMTEDNGLRPAETGEPYPAVLVVLGGEGRFIINETPYTAARGSVLMAAAGSIIRTEAERTLKFVKIQYICMTLRGIERVGAPDRTSYLTYSFRAIELSTQLVASWNDRNKPNPYLAQKLFLDLLLELSLEKARHEQEAKKGWLDPALAYIHNHYAEELSREQVAQYSQVTPAHFSRTFHKEIGKTFNAYLTTLRIRDVQNRLLTSKDSWNDWALAVGYKDGYYLSRKFKQVVGTTATLYLKKKKRIVSTNYNHTACLLALGIEPALGAYSGWIRTCYEAVPAHECQELYHVDARSSCYAKIAAAQPDLIIGYEQMKAKEGLLQLAPVVSLSFTKLDWREQFTMIAEITGKRPQAEAWLSQYEEQAEAANRQLDLYFSRRGTAVVWELTSKSGFAFGNRWGRGGQILYDLLGFQALPELMDGQTIMEKYIESPIEDLAQYDADHIFITSLPGDPQGNERVRRLFASEQWRGLKAVQNGRVYLLNNADLFYGFDPLSSEKQLQQIVQALIS